MTDKGMNSLLATSFKMGGDASVAAGPVGAGAKSDVVADLIAFSRSKGVYGGLNLDGTVVKTSTTSGTAPTTARRCCRRTSSCVARSATRTPRR